MAPIPIYTKSPINAAKAAGVTPQTASEDNARESHTSITPTKTRATSAGYPAAQPGAVPSLPVPTGAGAGPAPQAGRYGPLHPTPTQTLSDHGPPLPQPGAVPAPPSSKIPPPPRAGEAYEPSEPTTAPQAPNLGYPPQMSQSVQPPPLSQRGTSTAAPVASFYSQPQPLGAGALYGSQSNAASFPAHPHGYQQNVNAAEFTNQQRAAQNAQIELDRHQGSASSPSYDPADEGVWNSAVKWAQSAGDKIAAAESEVWRRINKE